LSGWIRQRRGDASIERHAASELTDRLNFCDCRRACSACWRCSVSAISLAPTPAILSSSLYADLYGLPPILIQVGSAETLLDDAVRLAGMAGTADVRVSLEGWPQMSHAWHLFYQQIAAGRHARATVGTFIRNMLNGGQAFA
jgi:acetyl esterase/lipase